MIHQSLHTSNRVREFLFLGGQRRLTLAASPLQLGQLLVRITWAVVSMTYCTWLRVDGLDRKFNSLLLTDGFHFNGPHWQIRQDGPLILGIRHPDTMKHDYQSDSEFNLFRLGQWVHLAMVYDSGKARVTHYVNGQVATREPIQDSATGLLQIGSAAIGNWGLSSEQDRGSQIRNLNGRMDELIVFGQALDDAEVRRIYEPGAQYRQYHRVLSRFST